MDYNKISLIICNKLLQETNTNKSLLTLFHKYQQDYPNLNENLLLKYTIHNLTLLGYDIINTDNFQVKKFIP